MTFDNFNKHFVFIGKMKGQERKMPFGMEKPWNKAHFRRCKRKGQVCLITLIPSMAKRGTRHGLTKKTAKKFTKKALLGAFTKQCF